MSRTICFITSTLTVDASSLSYMSSNTICPLFASVSMLNVITLAPPDYPLPFDFITMRIFRIFLVISTPCRGFSLRLSRKSLKSFLKLGYFLVRRLASLAKSLETLMLQLIRQTFCGLKFVFAGKGVFYFGQCIFEFLH